MKLKPLVPLILASLLGLLPSLAFGVPWDPARARPPGFQRTLAYLERDLYDYPNAELQSVRNTILHDDLVTTLLPKLKAWGEPPSRWAELVQGQLDQMRAAQYETLKTVIRQTMSDPDGVIRAVEGNQPIEGALLDDPKVKGLILLKWQMLNIAEQTYQALIHEGLISGGAGGSGGRPSPPTDIGPPKPGKGNPGLDLPRMREARRQAIERRKAFEAQAAREAAARETEFQRILKWLLSQAQSTNKFQARSGSGYLTPPAAASSEEPAATEPTPTATASEPPPSIEEIEKLEDQIEEAGKQADPPEKKPTDKVTVYQGTLILSRPKGWSDATWDSIKAAFKKELGQSAGISDMTDKGDEVTWRYKLLEPSGYALKYQPFLKDIPDKKTTKEDAKVEAKPAKPKSTFKGNGDADPVSGKIIPGTEQKPASPASDSTSASKSETVAETKAVPGYWYDPTDASRTSKDKYIYVRVDGEAVRVPLDEAENYGVPAGATIDTMTWYSDRTGKVVPGKDRGTHRGKDQPKSTNKFAKPKD
jgi:hypothetical protein